MVLPGWILLFSLNINNIKKFFFLNQHPNINQIQQKCKYPRCQNNFITHDSTIQNRWRKSSNTFGYSNYLYLSKNSCRDRMFYYKSDFIENTDNCKKYFISNIQLRLNSFPAILLVISQILF